MRRTFASIFLLFVCHFAAWTGHAPAQGLGEEPPVQAELLADTASVIPGKPFVAGLHLKLAPGWHTYWLNPGDSGIAVNLDWKLPPGWKAGPLLWPLPVKHTEPGEMTTYGYDGEVLLMTEVTPSANLPTGEISLKAHASWLACAKSCVPGNADVMVTLPAGSGTTGGGVSPQSALFARFRAQLPGVFPLPFTLRWEPHDTEVYLKINGAPDGAKLDFYPLDPLFGHPEQLEADVLRISLPKDGPMDRTNPPAVRGLLVMEHNGERAGWLVGNADAAPVPVKQAGPSIAPPASGGSGTVLTVARALGFGFIGGFLLNLMPCVLPVIALKILGFLGQAGESRRRVFRLGLAFVAGIFVWFLLLAAAIVVARSVGRQVNWAFQFQNPRFVLGATVFLFVFALNLLGVFEIWLPGANRLADVSGRGGYAGAFLHGVFATLLATPCTAPFLGPALGFALAQNALLIVIMFLAIAAGMSLPYLLLTAQPGWMRFLPRPGLWMVRFKQIMGFLLMGTVVWLIRIYVSERNAADGFGALWMLLGTGIACWIFGTWFTPESGAGRRIVVLSAMTGVISLGAALAAPSPVEDWAAWSPERVAALRAEGKPVFVDFTAEWCANCKYNEQFVLSTAEVRGALRGFATLRGDWTKGDPAITAEMRKLGRGGVPVYIVYPKGGGEPRVLPEILTERLVLDALRGASPAPVPAT